MKPNITHSAARPKTSAGNLPSAEAMSELALRIDPETPEPPLVTAEHAAEKPTDEEYAKIGLPNDEYRPGERRFEPEAWDKIREEKVGFTKGFLGRVATKFGLPERLRKKAETADALARYEHSAITGSGKRLVRPKHDGDSANFSAKVREIEAKNFGDREKLRRKRREQQIMLGTSLTGVMLEGYTGTIAYNKDGAEKESRTTGRMRRDTDYTTEEESANPELSINYWKLRGVQRNWDEKVRRLEELRDGVTNSLVFDDKTEYADIATGRTLSEEQYAVLERTDPDFEEKRGRFKKSTSKVNGRLEEQDRKLGRPGVSRSMIDEDTLFKKLKRIEGFTRPNGGWYSDPDTVIEAIESSGGEELLRSRFLDSYKRHLLFHIEKAKLGPRPEAKWYGGNPSYIEELINQIEDPVERKRERKALEETIKAYERGRKIQDDMSRRASGRKSDDHPTKGQKLRRRANRLERWSEESERKSEERSQRRQDRRQSRADRRATRRTSRRGNGNNRGNTPNRPAPRPSRPNSTPSQPSTTPRAEDIQRALRGSGEDLTRLLSDQDPSEPEN